LAVLFFQIDFTFINIYLVAIKLRVFIILIVGVNFKSMNFNVLAKKFKSVEHNYKRITMAKRKKGNIPIRGITGWWT